MLRKSWLNSVVVPLTAFVAVLTLASQAAEAQVKPFKITGSGFVPYGLSLIPGVLTPHVSTGQATELGNQLTDLIVVGYSNDGNYMISADCMTQIFSSGKVIWS